MKLQKRKFDINIRKLLAALLALALMLPAVDALAADMPYLIGVDLTNQIVTIYENHTGKVVRQMLCSSGKDNTTPTGTFTLPPASRRERKEWYYFRAFDCYARYATRIRGGIMFHSIPYNAKKESSISKYAVSRLGYTASHGCIRLRWQDAQFIAEKCLAGTKVKIYYSDEKDEDLREMLRKESFTEELGLSYEHYLGITDEEGTLGRRSAGAAVRDLQMRLRDLGLYSDEISGIYLGSTVSAVREAQSMMGLELSGVANPDFCAAIYASDAPFAMEVTLEDGMSGPAVLSLQRSLAALGLYTGPEDSVMDVEVTDAVKVFQGAYGFTVDGVASPTLQKAVGYEAGRLSAMFSQTGGYDVEKVTETIYMGKVNCEVGIRLREKPTVQSKEITGLRNGETLLVLEPGKTWSRVQRGKQTGYVRNDYVNYYPQEIASLRYTAHDGSSVYTIGYTLQEYYDGAESPAETFENYLAAGGSLTDYEGIALFCTVDAAGAALRRTPSEAGEVIEQLPGGTRLRVMVRSAQWTLVAAGDHQGYLPNDALEFWNAPEDTLDDAEDDEDEEEEAIATGAVRAANGKSAEVYDVLTDDAQLLGHLATGTQVEVMDAVEGWVLIRYQGHYGYIREGEMSVKSVS